MSARAIALVVALAAATTLIGCTTSRPVGPRFEVNHDPSATAEPLDIRLVSLAPGHPVTVAATAYVGGWSESTAIFDVPSSGVVDLASAVPQLAPYAEPDAMGLLWSLARTDGSDSASDPAWVNGTITVRFTATVDGRVVARREITRTGLAATGSTLPIRMPDMLADYFGPSDGSTARRPAVIVFAGADNGMQSGLIAAAQLAALGFPALALLQAPSATGTAQTLHAESFLTARAWLARQPDVDGERIFAFGAARSAPLALWAAAAYPSLVYGAIAPAGTTGVVCNSPVPTPTITVDGGSVPCTSTLRGVSGADLVPLDRIRGPVVLACAGRDETIPDACQWMTAAEHERGPHSGDTFLRASASTHVLYVPPFTPLYLPRSVFAQATENARVAFWSAVERTLLASVSTADARPNVVMPPNSSPGFP